MMTVERCSESFDYLAYHIRNRLKLFGDHYKHGYESDVLADLDELNELTCVLRQRCMDFKSVVDANERKRWEDASVFAVEDGLHKLDKLYESFEHLTRNIRYELDELYRMYMDGHEQDTPDMLDEMNTTANVLCYKAKDLVCSLELIHRMEEARKELCS